MLIFLIVVLVLALVLLCVATIIGLIGTIQLIRSGKRKQDGKSYKLQRVSGIILISLAVILLATYPTYSICNDINESLDVPEDYVDTGITIHQTYYDIREQHYILYNGDKYIHMDDLEIQRDLPKLAAYGGTKFVRTERFANILESNTVFPRNDYHYYVYKVYNDVGITLLKFEISLYMRECDVDKFVDYYANLADYDYYISDGQNEYQLVKKSDIYKFKILGMSENKHPHHIHSLKYLRLYSVDGVYSRQFNLMDTSSMDSKRIFSIINGDDEVYFRTWDESLTDELTQIMWYDWYH